MFKRYFMVLTLLFALPAFANAWTLNAKTAKIGQGTITPAGNAVYAVDADSAEYDVAPALGYTVARVTLDGVPLTANVNGKYVAPKPLLATTKYRYMVAYFAGNTVDITTTLNLGGSVREDSFESLTKIPVGSNRQILVTPNLGYSAAVTAAGATSIAPYGTKGAKLVVFDNLVANQTVDAVFTANAAVVTANAGQDVKTSGNALAYAATLYGSGTSSNSGALTYAWTCTAAPAGATTADLVFGTPAAAVTTVYSTKTGNYTVRLTVNGTASDTAIVNVQSSAAVSTTSCTSCHAGNTTAVVVAYNASAHKDQASCDDCHSAAPHTGATISQPRRIDADAVLTGPCVSCHTTQTAAQIKANVYKNEIADRFVTSQHATKAARANTCSSCHSHEGYVARQGLGKFTSGTALFAAYTSASSIDSIRLLPVGSSTIDGVSRKQCTTCHVEHTFALRGIGAEVVTGLLPANGSTLTADTTRTVFSAEFNLCVDCHQVKLDATFDPAEGYTGRGMFKYELTADYTAENLIVDDPTTTVIKVDVSDIYYHSTSGISRNFTDTHFAGTIATYLVDYNAADTNTGNTVLKGYNINPGSANACTICHDPHTAGKMLSVTTGQIDNNANKAVSFATGLGDFHTDYLSDPFSRENNGCTPCHTGNDFPRLTEGATLAELATAPSAANRWAVVGCRSCHDLAQANTTAGTNNAAAFDDVRAFPAGYEFKFTAATPPTTGLDTYAASFSYPAAAVVTAAELGNSAICFECHKGRTAGVMPATEAAAGTQNYAISYLHYAPSAAILFGNDAKMALTYPGKTYAGRMTHYDGTTKLNCTDCHNVHTGADVMYTNATCNGCHNVGSPTLSKDALAARTQAFSVALLDAVYDAMFVAYNNGTPDAALNATLKTKLAEIFTAADEATGKDILMTYIEERQVTFPSRKIAHAATTWKIFTYEDGPENGQAHGHGGSWAHNSKFARQLMYDAIESLGVNPATVYTLSRP